MLFNHFICQSTVINFQQFFYYFRLKTIPNYFCWNPTNNSIRRHILCYNCASRYYGSLPYVYPRHNSCTVANPNIIAHNDITFRKGFIAQPQTFCFVWICRNCIHTMFYIKHKVHMLCN